MNKELIKRLYDEGKITFDEMVDLIQEKKPSDDQTNNTDSRHFSIHETAEKLLIDLTSRYYDDPEIPEGYVPFDIDKCVDYMNQIDWQWRGESVDRKMFEKELLRDIERALRGLFDDIRDGEKDPQSSVEGGGIGVVAYLDEREDENGEYRQFIVIEPYFKIEEGYADICADHVEP